jgi:hypothetical protein
MLDALEGSEGMQAVKSTPVSELEEFISNKYQYLRVCM